jgi:hypothetical protein
MDLIPASAPHWHLVLNHLPSVGALVAVCLLAGARYTGSRDLTRASLLLFVVLALVAIPVFISGGAAGSALLGTPDISEPALTAHLDAALLALGALLVTGWLAWFALWRDRRRPGLDGGAPIAVLGVGAVSLFLMLWTARIGGFINHQEIHAGTAIEAGGTGLSAGIVDFVFGSAWVWPAMEALHFLGMALLFGSILLASVRVLGVARAPPPGSLRLRDQRRHRDRLLHRRLRPLFRDDLGLLSEDGPDRRGRHGGRLLHHLRASVGIEG